MSDGPPPGAVSDHKQLEAELNYTKPRNDTRFFKTKPAGYNLIIVSGGILFLVAFALTSHFARGVLGSADPRGLLGAGLGVLVGAVLGYSLPPRLWVAIGPVGRAILRPFGWFGGAPFFFLLLFLLFMGSAILRGVPRDPGALGPAGSPSASDAELEPG